MNKYEATIIFRESLKDTDWDDAVATVRSEIERLGGSLDSCTRIGKRDFARMMQKETGGHYGLLGISLAGDKVAPLLARLKLNDLVFRIQIVVAKANAPAAPQLAEPTGDDQKEGADGVV